MKMMKKVLLSLLIAASVGAVSSSALAETDPGRITYSPSDAVDLVMGKIQLALNAIEQGADGEQADKQYYQLAQIINSECKVLFSALQEI